MILTIMITIAVMMITKMMIRSPQLYFYSHISNAKAFTYFTISLFIKSGRESYFSGNKISRLQEEKETKH